MTAERSSPPPSRGAAAAAWCVHALTASGAFLGVLALAEIQRARWSHAFWLLVAATAIDSFDGGLARRFRVKSVLPGFDGALLDNIVDYFTYAVVPAVYVYSSGRCTGAWATMAAGLMVFSSAYQFCQADAKTGDHYFKGWPSYWNVVALYLLLLDTGPRASFAIIAVCAVLVFVPVKYLYPSRTQRFRAATLAFTTAWAAAVLVALWQHPDSSVALVYGSLLYVAYYAAASLWITLRGE